MDSPLGRRIQEVRGEMEEFRQLVENSSPQRMGTPRSSARSTPRKSPGTPAQIVSFPTARSPARGTRSPQLQSPAKSPLRERISFESDPVFTTPIADVLSTLPPSSSDSSDSSDDVQFKKVLAEASKFIVSITSDSSDSELPIPKHTKPEPLSSDSDTETVPVARPVTEMDRSSSSGDDPVYQVPVPDTLDDDVDGSLSA
jgi:hypothetical protein